MKTINTSDKDKICPNCKRQLLYSEQVCECGYNFIDGTNKNKKKTSIILLLIAALFISAVISTALNFLFDWSTAICMAFILPILATVVLLYHRKKS